MVVAFVGIAVAAVVGVMMVKDSFTPNNAKKVASEMVSLPDPLPRGWMYGVGVDMGYSKSANVQNMKSGKGHVLIQFNQMQVKGNQSAEFVANKFAFPNVAGMEFELESKGEREIGGQTAYYIRQHGIVIGKKSAVEVALLDMPNGGILQIQTSEDGQDKFDPSIADPFLKSIKSIGKAKVDRTAVHEETQ